MVVFESALVILKYNWTTIETFFTSNDRKCLDLREHRQKNIKFPLPNIRIDYRCVGRKVNELYKVDINPVRNVDWNNVY